MVARRKSSDTNLQSRTRRYSERTCLSRIVLRAAHSAPSTFVAELKRSAKMNPANGISPQNMKSFRFYRSVKETPDSCRYQRKRRWRVFFAGCFSICVSSFLGWKLLSDSRGTMEARVVGLIVIPLMFIFSVRLVVLCFLRKEGDPFYADLEKHAD